MELAKKGVNASTAARLAPFPEVDDEDVQSPQASMSDAVELEPAAFIDPDYTPSKS